MGQPLAAAAEKARRANARTCSACSEQVELWPYKTSRACTNCFTALHWMQGGLVARKVSVRLSVCPPVRQTRRLWKKIEERAVHIFYTLGLWKIIWPSFLRRRMVGWVDPFYLKFWVNRHPLERKRRCWTDIRSYRLSPNTYQNTFN